MPSNTVETVFRFSHDRAAANAVLRDQDRIDDALKDTTRSADRLEDAYDGMERASVRAARAQADLAEAQIRAARETAEVYGDVASRTTAFSGLASGLGGAALGGRMMIAADILDATEAAKLFKAELPKMVDQLAGATGGVGNLAMAGGIAAAALVGLYVAVDALGDKARKSREAVLAELEFEEARAALAPEKKTTAVLDAEIKALNDAIEAREEYIRRLEDDRKALHDSYSALEQLGEELGVYNQGLDDIDKALSDLKIKQEADIKLRNELVFTLGEEAVKLNDRKNRLVDNTAATQDNSAALNENTKARTTESEAVMTSSIAAARAAKNIQLLGANLDLINQQAALADKYEADRRAIIDETNAKIAALETKWQGKRLELAAVFEADRARAETEYKDRTGAALADYNETLADLNEDYRDEETRRLKEFERQEKQSKRDHRRSILEAAANLDAWAVLNEQRRFKDERQTAKENFDDEKTEAKKAFDDRLRDAERAYDKELAAAKKAHDDQLRAAEENYDRQYQAQKSAYSAELTALQNQQTQRLSALQTQYTGELQKLSDFHRAESLSRAGHYKNLLEQQATWQRDSEALLQRAGTGTTRTGGSGGSAHYRTQYQLGGYTPGNWIKTELGEFVMTPQTTRLAERMAGGALTQRNLQQMFDNHRSIGNINLNFGDLGNKTPAQIERIVNRALNRWMAEM